MGEATFTFRVDEDLMNDFDRAVKSGDRDGVEVLTDFMRDFVEAREHDVWFRRQVEVGRDAADAGDLVSHEEVEAEAEDWRARVRG